MDNIVTKQIIKYLLQYNIHDSKKSGFRTFHGTKLHQFIIIIYKYYVRSIIADNLSAFGTVMYDLLIDHLHMIRLSDTDLFQ